MNFSKDPNSRWAESQGGTPLPYNYELVGETGEEDTETIETRPVAPDTPRIIHANNRSFMRKAMMRAGCWYNGPEAGRWEHDQPVFKDLRKIWQRIDDISEKAGLLYARVKEELEEMERVDGPISRAKFVTLLKDALAGLEMKLKVDDLVYFTELAQ